MFLHIGVALICLIFSEDNGDEGESSSGSADEDEKNKAHTVGNHSTLY